MRRVLLALLAVGAVAALTYRDYVAPRVKALHDRLQAQRDDACVKKIGEACLIDMVPFCMPAFQGSGACERAMDYCDSLTREEKLTACVKGELPNKPLQSYTTHWHYEYAP